MAATPDGRGYWLADGAGRVYGFGDASSRPVPAARVRSGLVAAFSALMPRPGGGYWLGGQVAAG